MALLVALAAVAVLPACGDDDDGGAVQLGTQAGPAGMLSWALADRPRILDPLYASTNADRLAARQIYEPLVEELAAPYEDARRFGGLALSLEPSAEATVWRMQLRAGVRFQDGTSLNASAVLANANRWLASSPGRALLGDAILDAPGPDLVRFVLPTPNPGFEQVLASPRLGLVSPRTLAAAGGGHLDPSEAENSGTGPFELRERSADRILLARNTAWWGSAHGLGPGIDQLELTGVADPRERLSELRDGSIEVAGDLDRSSLHAARHDPLLTIVPEGAGKALAVERSVRGIPAGEPTPSLNAVWLTGITGG